MLTLRQDAMISTGAAEGYAESNVALRRRALGFEAKRLRGSCQDSRALLCALLLALLRARGVGITWGGFSRVRLATFVFCSAHPWAAAPMHCERCRLAGLPAGISMHPRRSLRQVHATS